MGAGEEEVWVISRGSMAPLPCLLRCPEVPVAAGLQAEGRARPGPLTSHARTLPFQVYVGSDRATQAAEGQSPTLSESLSAAVMDEVSRLASSAPAAAPAVVAARRLLRPEASCTSSRDVFRALRPEMEAFQAEVRQDSHDFVPLLSAEGTASAINLIMGAEGQQMLSEAWLEESVGLHKDRTDAERRNLKRRTDALDVLGGGVRKAWARMSRSVEAKFDAHLMPPGGGGVVGPSDRQVQVSPSGTFRVSLGWSASLRHPLPPLRRALVLDRRRCELKPDVCSDSRSRPPLRGESF
jgi:hypothetical protein